MSKLAGVAYTERGILDEAKDELRKLGGWAIDSSIPNLYAARFIQEKANESNMLRLASERQEDNFLEDLVGRLSC
jgi:hypothetical protein